MGQDKRKQQHTIDAGVVTVKPKLTMRHIHTPVNILVCGASGCGKTTSVRQVCELLHPGWSEPSEAGLPGSEELPNAPSARLVGAHQGVVTQLEPILVQKLDAPWSTPSRYACSECHLVILNKQLQTRCPHFAACNPHLVRLLEAQHHGDVLHITRCNCCHDAACNCSFILCCQHLCALRTHICVHRTSLVMDQHWTLAPT